MFLFPFELLSGRRRQQASACSLCLVYSELVAVYLDGIEGGDGAGGVCVVFSSPF